MSSQLHSGFIWVQAVAHLLLSWLRVIPLSQSSILAKHELGNSFCNCIFCQKGVELCPYSYVYNWMNTENIHTLWWTSWWCLCNYSCLIEYTKAVIYTVVKVGGGKGHGPATDVTHLRLNQPPVFSSAFSGVCSSLLIYTWTAKFMQACRHESVQMICVFLAYKQRVDDTISVETLVQRSLSLQD